MSDVVGGLQVAVVFVWLGMVLAISFLETPLKFRAPGVTVEAAVGIGRLVFRALNATEGVFAFALIACAFAGSAADSGLTAWLLATVCVILGMEALVLRRAMDRRARAGRAAERMPRNLLHIGYILLELLKVIGLVALGIALLRA